MLLEVDKESFEEEVLEAEGLVVADWWSPSCRPCCALTPKIEQMAATYDRVKFVKVNVMENRRLALSQQVLGLPTFLFYRDGQVVTTLTGGECTAKAIEDEVQRLLEEVRL